MAEENNNAAAQPAADQVQQGPVMQLERCYLKDASLEMPNAPEVFYMQLEEQPTIDVQFEVVPQGLPVEHRVEVAVRGTITVKAKDKTLFLVEGKQAGIFEIRGFSDEQVQMIVNIACPTIVYPYLRANLADIVTRTGMPPVHLPEVNFEALYQQRMAQAQQQAAEAANSSVQQPA